MSEPIRTVLSGVSAATIRLLVPILAFSFLLSCSDRPDSSRMSAERCSIAPKISIEEFRKGLKDAGIWSGGPAGRFESVGEASRDSLVEYGLMPDHKLLDIGAGSLRVGWWILQCIPQESYYATEPARERIDTVASLIGADNIHIYYNDDWEFPDVDFDFVFARSIWTHASKDMIAKMIAEFVENSAEGGKFLTSVNLAESEEDDYMGDEWVGVDTLPYMIAHSPEWIEEESAKHGLTVEYGDELFGQRWVLITKSMSAGGPR